jgi:phage terminase large subunit
MQVDLTDYENQIQPSYRSILWDKTRELMFCGGAGAGKSYSIAQKVIYRCISEPNTTHLVCRKTARSNRISTHPLICGIMDRYGLTSLYSTNKTDLTIVFHEPINSIIYFVGLDDVEKLKSIVDLTSIWVEEASEITEDDYRQLQLRLRGGVGDYHQLISSTNPVGGKRHWIYRHFFQRDPGPNTKVLLSNVYHNQYADESYIDALEAIKRENPTLGKIYLDGDFADMVGQIFEYDTFPHYNPFLYKYPHYIGLDFGYNDPTAVVSVRVDNVTKSIYCNELLYESNYTNQDVIQFLLNHPLTKKKDLDIICDSAEPARIEELRRAGLKAIPAIKGAHSVLQSIYLLQNYKINVYEDSHNLIGELSSYCWQVKDGLPIDQPIGYNDHLIAGIRYVMYTKYGMKYINPNSPPLIDVGNIYGSPID